MKAVPVKSAEHCRLNRYKRRGNTIKVNEKEALLQQLSDIKAPEPVSWWPPAPGWWVLALLIVLALTWGTWLWLQHRKHTRYRKQALRILHDIEAQKQFVPPAQSLEKILSLLKRSALTAYKHSRNTIAHLYGHEFFVFLEATLKQSTIKIEPRWHNAIYQPGIAAQPNFPLHQFLDFTRYWIKQHRNLQATELQQLMHHANINNQPQPYSHASTTAAVEAKGV